VPARLPKEEYRKVMLKALNELKEFKPDIVAVSAGFDCYKRDPLGQMTFEAEDFHWLGKQVRELGVPAFSLLEGGYSTQLPELIFAYLKGLAGK
jgi:acetoin utilization deacetylase AcuC-like enzyme